MADALVLVDIQNDFLPGGALAVPNGDAVVEVANRLIPEFRVVVATQDWHPDDHGSFASQHGLNVGDQIELNGLNQILWPDHCIQGSFGAEFSAELNLPSDVHVIRKGTDPTVDSYSGFFDNGQRNATGMDDLLRELAVQQRQIVRHGTGD